jgi:nicotinamidase-related amidase
MLGDRPVLVVIDMQRAIDMPGRPARGNPDLDRNGQRLIALFRAAGRPIVHVRHDSVEPDSWFHPSHPGNALRPGFEPGPGEGLVVKSVNAAFIGTDLDLRLRRLGATSVVCCGWASDMCVSTTVRVGANIGWPMVLVPEACDCCDLPDPFGPGVIAARDLHRAHMATLAADFCRLASLEEIAAAP